ncbi:hypothetical protein [Flavobacterium sp. ZB4P13]
MKSEESNKRITPLNLLKKAGLYLLVTIIIIYYILAIDFIRS